MRNLQSLISNLRAASAYDAICASGARKLMSVHTSLWKSPPAELDLAPDETHVWRAALDAPPSQVDALRQTLSADELQRADRFHFPRDQRRFIVGRGLLRVILSRYVQTPPHTLRFTYTAFGKPNLVLPPDHPPLNFNVAHSEGFVLYALIRDHDAIGVDVEHTHRMIEYDQIAARFFSPTEYASLRALPENQRATAFFTCWTRKEAYIKACGVGLSMPLDRFAVSLAPDEPARLLYTIDDPAEATRWSLQDLFPGPGYQAALAVKGHGWRLRCWQWQETGS
jgi:4'-phosphopantetheinyl transferase